MGSKLSISHSPTLAVVVSVAACIGPSSAQPIIHEDYQPHLGGFQYALQQGPRLLDCRYPSSNGGTSTIRCNFSEALTSIPGMPSVKQYLAMFSDKFVEYNGKVYTVKNAKGTGGFSVDETFGHNGLYEVRDYTDGSYKTYNSWATLHIIYKDDNIGQIVASDSRFHPIQVIGVDQIDNKIYGYYPDGGSWSRIATVWGDAKDGSLRSEPGGSDIIGLSSNDRMFNLWGDSDDPFQYAKHDDIECSGSPASIGEWTGYLHTFRGFYCPSVGNHQLIKNTWHSSGWEDEELIWTPASKITRLGPESALYGISTDGKLLVLYHDGNKIRSAPLDHLSELHDIRAVGGLDDKWGAGVLVSNGEDRVYTTWWDGVWKQEEVSIDRRFIGIGQISIFFGSHEGDIYMLYAFYDENVTNCVSCHYTKVYLYRLDFTGNDGERYKAVRIQGGDWL